MLGGSLVDRLRRVLASHLQMARSFLPLGLLAILVAGCSGEAGSDDGLGPNPPLEGGDADQVRGTVPATVPDAPPGDPAAGELLVCGAPQATDLGAADSRN